MKIIRERIEGNFDNKKEADEWYKQMKEKGYTLITKPFKNPFAYSNQHPWYTVAEKQTND